jgi:hypothetical protein
MYTVDLLAMATSSSAEEEGLGVVVSVWRQADVAFARRGHAFCFFRGVAHESSQVQLVRPVLETSSAANRIASGVACEEHEQCELEKSRCQMAHDGWDLVSMIMTME